ncbi:hypothetical protein AKJ16_DCAP19203 [Drosera capensis]
MRYSWIFTFLFKVQSSKFPFLKEVCLNMNRSWSESRRKPSHGLSSVFFYTIFSDRLHGFESLEGVYGS